MCSGISSCICFSDVSLILGGGSGFFHGLFFNACEWNLNAIEALQHNLQASSVSDRCIILEGDNQITAPKVRPYTD